jgi:hypothetical protein
MNVITKSAKKAAIWFVVFVPYVCIMGAITGTSMWFLNIQDTWETAVKVVVFITPITSFIGLYIPVFALQLFPDQRYSSQLCKMPINTVSMIFRELVSQTPALIAWGIVLSVISPLCTAVYIVSNLTLLVATVASVVMFTKWPTQEEMNTNKVNRATDKDGNEICYDIPSLWEEVKNRLG